MIQFRQTCRLVFLTITTFNPSSYSMEHDQNSVKRKFRVFFLKNKDCPALNIRLKDSVGKNLIDMVHPGNGYCLTAGTVAKPLHADEPNPYYFVVRTNEKVMVFVDQQDNKIRYPMRAYVWKGSDRPSKKNISRSLFSFIINKKDHGKKIIFKSIKTHEKFVDKIVPVAFLKDKSKALLLAHQELMMMFAGIYCSTYKNAVYDEKNNMIITLTNPKP